MGQSGSKGKKQGLLGTSSSKKKGGGDDGCIGNRKVRTITICILLIAFVVFAAAYCFKQKDDWNKAVNADILNVCDACKKARNAWTIIVTGGFITIGFAIFAALLSFVDVNDNIAKICGIGLIIGGVLYLGGTLYYVGVYRDTISDVIWDNLPDEVKSRINARLSAQVGEALLPAGTAILLGLDVFMKLFENESHRLFSNLGNLCIVAIVCFPAYYVNTNDDNESVYAPTSDAYPYIATGYAVIFWVTLVYIILYVCACCTCNCKDTACARIIIAIGLCIGGILASIGYYIYAGELDGPSDETSKTTVYYIGYTVLIAGCCIIWALDIALDDVKNTSR